MIFSENRYTLFRIMRQALVDGVLVWLPSLSAALFDLA
jgi:hypothetical protein